MTVYTFHPSDLEGRNKILRILRDDIIDYAEGERVETKPRMVRVTVTMERGA